MTLATFRTFLQNHVRTFARIDPARDWLILMTISAMALASLITWSALAFDTVASGGVIGEPVQSSEPALSQASLDAIHAVFTERAAEEASYEGDLYHYADPSH